MQVVAHRGSSAERPEHTLAAYERAIEQGVDGVECDVRLTADGHLVCVHDRRVDRTSDGRGVVSTLELADLRTLDFGVTHQQHLFDGLDEVPDRTRTGILTLPQLIETVLTAEQPVDLAIETKHPTRYGGIVEHRLIEVLERYGLARPRYGEPSPVRVMSFSWLSLRRIRRRSQRLRTVYLMDRLPPRFADGSLPLGVSAAGPSIDVVRQYPGCVRRWHRQGYTVHVWTVNQAADVDLCLELGVDVCITDRPGAVLDRLGRAVAAPSG